MPKNSKYLILSLSLALVLFTVIGGLGVKAASTTSDGAYRQLGVYSEVLSRIRSEYVEEPNIPTVTDGALHGLLEALDANSSYLSPAEYKAYKAREKDPAKAGVGAAISKRFGYAAVVAALPGGAADKAGIETGDIIEAIENKSTRDMSLAEIEGRLSGAPGSRVNVTIVRVRRAEPSKLVIIRDTEKIPPAGDKLLNDSIGYIKLDALPRDKSLEVTAKVQQLQKQGAKKLILDLRNCAAGDEKEGVALANLFLNHGTIAYVQGQKYPRETFNADPQKAISNLPLAVLVNRGTAGAAELAAGALLENARADVLGEKTFGVGSIQKLLEIPDGSALLLSVAKYYTPGGKAIQDTAITPNITVANAADQADLTDEEENPGATPEPNKKPLEDEPLKRAIEVLKNRDVKAALTVK